MPVAEEGSCLVFRKRADSCFLSRDVQRAVAWLGVCGPWLRFAVYAFINCQGGNNSR
jgi:hypothetical protein